MAEGSPTASGSGIVRVTERRMFDDEDIIKKVFSSALWYYSVHKYIGDIVQANHFNIDYQPERKRIYFQWYCDTVSPFMEYICASKLVAISVLKALPTLTNLAKDILSDPDALIAEQDAIYILATYNFECFGYLLSSFAIDLKQSCLDFVEKQLQKLAEKNPSDLLSELIKVFTSKQANSLFDQKKRAVEEIETTLANKYLIALKRTIPSSSFIISKEIDHKAMPPVPDDPKSWEEYFLQVCSTRLSLALAKEKEEFETDFSEPRERLQPKIIGQLERLSDLLNNPGVPPIKHPYPFTAFTQYFREDISELIGEKLH